MSASGIEAVRSEAAAKIVTELTDLAAFCEESKLYKERDRCATLLIHFEPDHAQSRKWLKYSKKDGEWTRRGTYREPKNYEEELEPIAKQRFKVAVDAYVSAVLDVVEPAWNGLKIEERRPLVADLLAVATDNERARLLNGEVWLDSSWKLIEAQTSRHRRIVLKTEAKKAIDNVETPKSIVPTAEENALGVSWNAGFKGKRWRAIGTVGSSELKRVHAVAEAAKPFLDEAFGIGFNHPPNAGFYLLTGKKQAKTVLTNHPFFDDRKRDFLLKLASTWVGRTPVFMQWSSSASLRLDGSTRQVLGLLLMRQFGFKTDTGWAWEGIGLYLDYQLTGTRLTYTVVPEYTTTLKFDPREMGRRMNAPGANWIELARALVVADQGVTLAALLKKKVNQLDHRDVLFSYALAAYLIEGCAQKGTQFLSRYGGPDSLDRATRDSFGLTAEEFEQHFHRWLKER